MVCHGTGQPVGEISVFSMKTQEGDHRPKEILDVFGLGLLSASGVGLLLLDEALGGSFGIQFRPNPFDSRSPREKSFGPSFPGRASGRQLL